MTVPFKSVRVGPFDLAIKPLNVEDRDKCLGMFSETQMSILMRETYGNDQQEAETFLHELLHAIYSVFGVHPEDTEERMINQMSIGMATVIRDNAGLMDWLKEKLS
jgi:hypothetical protein